jgi:hypothetical protein
MMSGLGVYAQVYFNNIAQAFKQGDAKALSAYFDQTVDLTFSEETNTYSKKHAEQILHKFFAKIEPQDFTQRSGDSKYNKSKYSIGILKSSKGTYKVYLFFIYRGEKGYLRELRFEK